MVGVPMMYPLDGVGDATRRHVSAVRQARRQHPTPSGVKQPRQQTTRRPATLSPGHFRAPRFRLRRFARVGLRAGSQRETPAEPPV